MTGSRPGPDGPDEETVLRAWDMRVAGKSPAHIAETFKVSVSTAKRYVKAGRDLAEVVEFSAKVADPLQFVDIRNEQQRQAATVDRVIEWMSDYVDNGGDEVQASMVVLKALERRAKALGSDPPTAARLTLEAPQPPPTVPGHVVEAIESYQRGDMQ